MNGKLCENEVQSESEIQTFVFFDLETTDLIRGSSIPKIIEISLIATSRDSLFTKDGSLPRVLHKLTIPLQPLKLIPLEVSEITGLYNDLLENEKPFDEHVYILLNSFINRLHPPICFVAHNGNRFDYPILLITLKSLGKTLSEDILCIDSYLAFKDLLNNNLSNNVKESIPHQAVERNSNLFENACDEALAAVVDVHTVLPDGVKTEENKVEEEKWEMDSHSMQKANETSPTLLINSPINMIPRKRCRQIDRMNVKRRLPFTPSKPLNFKLDTIYEHLLGTAPLDSHSAEGDCLAILLCAMKIGKPFIHWADCNASPLVQYKVVQK